MSDSSRVSIPKNVGKTIQDIKEVTRKHSEEDIYSMLKECNMDPNDTVQRLLYLDTFHEVKRKRDRRKNVSGGASEESRWKTGRQHRGARSGRQHFFSPYKSCDMGDGKNVSARKENGVNSHTETRFSSSNISVNDPISVINGSCSHGRAPQLSAAVAGVYSSASDLVSMPSLNSWVPGVGTIKHAVGPPGIANSSNRTRTRKPQQVGNSQLSEHSQPSALHSHDGSLVVVSYKDIRPPQQLIGTSKVVASEAATVPVEVSSQSLLEVNASALEKATSELDMKLAKLNISAHQPVIFPHHIQVPEDYKTALTFGSLDVTFGQSTKYINGPGDGEGSSPATEFIPGNDETGREPSQSNQSVSSMAQDDYLDHPQSPPDVSESLPPFEDNASSGSVPKYGEPKQDIMLHLGGPQHPLVQTTPGYGSAFGQPLPGGQRVQFEGLPQSTSGLTLPATPPAGIGQSSVAASPQQVPVIRHPCTPDYFSHSHYFPAVYLPPNAQQFLGHGTNTGHPTHFGIPFGYGSYDSSPVGYSASPTVISGSFANNQDIAASELKENNIYSMAQQREGSLFRFPQPLPGRDISTFQVNSFYNLPRGQHFTFSIAQAGHGPFARFYHPTQTMAAPSTAYPFHQPSQAMAGSVEALQPPSAAYQLPQHALNWNPNYSVS